MTEQNEESQTPTTDKVYTGQEQAGTEAEGGELETPTTDEVYTGQEQAAESTKDADSVKAVADPSAHGGLPKWPKEETGTPVVVNESKDSK
jgi:hypothetical protein